MIIENEKPSDQGGFYYIVPVTSDMIMPGNVGNVGKASFFAIQLAAN